MSSDTKVAVCIVALVLICVTVFAAFVVQRVTSEHLCEHFHAGCHEVTTGRVNDQYTSKLDCPR